MGGQGTKRLEQSSRALVRRLPDQARKRLREGDAPPAPPAPRVEPNAQFTLRGSEGSVQAKASAKEDAQEEVGDAEVEFDVEVNEVRVPAGGGKRVIVVLDKACLEPVKSKSGKFELLNCDDHLALHKKLGRDPADSRPDIAHQCLLSLLDSPLNKAGLLAVILRTESGVLVEVDPSLRIPRTFKRFAGLMVQLLHKLRIRATVGSKTLLRVIKNPVTAHLPTNARKFALEANGTLVDPFAFVDHLPEDDSPIVFVIGAMARGNVAPDYVDRYLSISQYPLSGSVAISRLLSAFERKWNVI